jgi:hypothetical protein
MKPRNLILFSLIFFTIAFSTCKALEITVPQAKYVNGCYYIVKGQTADITLKGNPNENVNIEITYKFDLCASNGKYSFSQSGFPIPLNAKFYVKAYPVEDLTVEAKIFFFLGKTLHATAKNGVAVVSANVPKGSYDIKLYGKTNYSVVHIECTAKTTVKLDGNGKYVVSYDTSKLPVGYMVVNANGVTIKAYIVSSEDEIPTPTTTPTQTTPITTTVKPTPKQTTPVVTTTTPKPTISTTPTITTTITATTTPLITTTNPITTTTTQVTTTTTTVITTVTTTVQITPNKSNKTTVKQLKTLQVDIKPKDIVAKPGETVKIILVLNWSPKDWKGKLNTTVKLCIDGIGKKYVFKNIDVLQNPPITIEIPIRIPKDILPTSYDLIVEVSANNVTSKAMTTLSVVQTPGFEFTILLIAGALALLLRLRLKN